MANQRYTGLDGEGLAMTKGTAIVGDGSAVLAEGFYETKIVADTSSGLPTGATVGYIFYADATAAITPAVAEEVYPVTFEKWCFIQNASLDIANAEIDVTLPCDEVSTYEVGRADMSGSINGIFTDAEGWKTIQNKGITLNEQDADLSAQTISAINSDNIYLRIDKNKNSKGSYKDAFYLLPVKLTNISNDSNFDGTAPQTFSSDFRVAADDTKAQLFILNNA